MQTAPTPSQHALPFRPADFPTLTDALNYAAGGETGFNFYSSGELRQVLPFSELRRDALSLARKLRAMGARPGDRLALMAETDPYFPRFFFASLYAGLIPVPLPAAVKLGAHTALVNQIRSMLESCRPSFAVASESFLPYLEEAGEGLGITMVATPETFAALAESDSELPDVSPDDIAFIQYTSGSTRFPKGVVVTHRGAMSNLHGIAAHGVRVVPGDRCTSWLPFYHDMGLVGFMLVPMASQLSVDYLATHEFAMRPGQWLKMISANRASISFGPCFGFELCARRIRKSELQKYDLSTWRVAGIGAEMIRPQSLHFFAEKLAPAGFDAGAFLPCYGMAECTLAISFSSPGQGFTTDFVDLDELYDQRTVSLLDPENCTGRGRHFVNCGRPLPGYEVEIRDDEGNILEDYATGIVHLKGPSIMAGYYHLPDETREALSDDGWFCTGDIGYLANGSITLTGRQKDLIIINGRNIWPQDLEHLCETLSEVRVGDAVAFSAPGKNDEETCVVVVQCREQDEAKREQLRQTLLAMIRLELSLDGHVELVPARWIPVTSSGKRSRSKARQLYLEAFADAQSSADRGGRPIDIRTRPVPALVEEEFTEAPRKIMPAN